MLLTRFAQAHSAKFGTPRLIRGFLALLPLLAPAFMTSCGATSDGPFGISTAPRRPDTVRAAFPAGEPPEARPSFREQREARARLHAEAEQYARGGIPAYRPNGASSSLASVGYVAQPEALAIDYAASPGLNSFDGQPHALALVVYHLRDRAAFDRLARHEEGMRKLLEADYFDEGSVRGVRRHDVQPGESGRLLLDRAEGGRYVAVVAGYGGHLGPNAVFVTEYGLGEYLSPGDTALHNKKRMYMPLPLHLQAFLRDDGMTVRDSGIVTGRMDRVTSLSRQQAHHLLYQEAR